MLAWHMSSASVECNICLLCIPRSHVQDMCILCVKVHVHARTFSTHCHTTVLFAAFIVYMYFMCGVFLSYFTSAVKLDKKKQRNKEISFALQHAAHSSGGYYWLELFLKFVAPCVRLQAKLICTLHRIITISRSLLYKMDYIVTQKNCHTVNLLKSQMPYLKSAAAVAII